MKQPLATFVAQAEPLPAAPASRSQVNAPLEKSNCHECQPAGAPPPKVRSFALRIGNRRYPFMKIRLTRPARKRYYVFSVDAHDACLHAAVGSHDAVELEKLKRFNAQLAQEILAVWDAAGIITEREYLRRVIRQTRKRQGARTSRTAD